MDDDDFGWNDAFALVYVAVALLGVGGIIAYVWTALT